LAALVPELWQVEKKDEKYPLEVLRRRAELGIVLLLRLPFYKWTLRQDL